MFVCNKFGWILWFIRLELYLTPDKKLQIPETRSHRQHTFAFVSANVELLSLSLSAFLFVCRAVCQSVYYLDCLSGGLSVSLFEC